MRRQRKVPVRWERRASHPLLCSYVGSCASHTFAAHLFWDGSAGTQAWERSEEYRLQCINHCPPEYQQEIGRENMQTEMQYGIETLQNIRNWAWALASLLERSAWDMYWHSFLSLLLFFEVSLWRTFCDLFLSTVREQTHIFTLTAKRFVLSNQNAHSKCQPQALHHVSLWLGPHILIVCSGGAKGVPSFFQGPHSAQTSLAVIALGLESGKRWR